MLVLFFGRSSAGQPAAPAPVAARYQLVIENKTIFICDTHTGQVWCRGSALPGVDKWTEMESPVMKEKK
jgi:hypothetical protein